MAAAAPGRRPPGDLPRRACAEIRDGGSVKRNACYLGLGVPMDGERDVLCMWFREAEYAKF
jgi:transposase-like protein